MDTCKICPNEFKRKYSRGKQRKIYCSKKCRYADSYIDKICLACKQPFRTNLLSKRKEYCSLGCIQRLPCQLCGTIITGRKTFQSGEKKFCTRKCSNFFHRTIASKKAYIPKGFAETIKKFNKICCERCKIDDIRCLIVHHLDADRNNNSLPNLQTLCANCHHIEHWGDTKKREKHSQLAKMLAKF